MGNQTGWRREIGGMPYWALAAAVVAIVGLGTYAALNVPEKISAAPFTPRPVSSFSQTPTPTADPVPAAAAPIIDLDFTSLDGIPEETTAGQPLGTREAGRSTGPFTIEDGALRHGTPTAANAASYLEAPIGKNVDTIGAEALFPTTGTSGQIALVVWSEQLTDGGPIPTAGIHFVSDAYAWHVSVWNNGETNYAEGKIATAETDLTQPRRFEIVRAEDRIWIKLPDGKTAGPFQNPAIASMSSEWASWELYENTPDLTPAAFTRVWAG